ncbi:polysaccharide deacetylase family protein [Paraflavitalea pollutisoli]|uniref:polysaccharide deacetylase family protein n=1 Tax=Paraflavitalea pollutisoli TaxID=3034143 RepID=UPI0023ED480D|nr:polysaccharide deacetylase family protein [Paraflavitalea sp. H1-2-19X]
MRKYLLALLANALLLLSLSCTAQESPIRLIVRGDDMGFSHSGNLALIKCFKEGIERSIEVIVPSPWFPEAVKLLAEHPTVDVGIHLALTSEWDNVKWRPLTYAPSLTDSSGYFYPKIWADAKYPNGALLQHAWQLGEVEKEFRAQIELALKKIPRISHISAHMGCTYMSPEVSALAKKLAREYGIDIDLEALGVKGVNFIGAHGTLAEKKKSFSAMLQSLQPGGTYMFLEHPGLNDAELQAIHHIGYENVAADRQGVTDLWTDPAIKALIRERKIQLISYADLKR